METINVSVTEYKHLTRCDVMVRMLYKLLTNKVYLSPEDLLKLLQTVCIMEGK